MVLIRHGLGRRLLLAAFCAAGVSCATPPAPPEPVPEVAPKAVPSPAVTPAPARKTPAAPSAELRIAAVGDIMLGGTAAPEMQKFGYDYPFEQTKNILKQAQIVFGNLEGPLTDAGTAEAAKQYVFRSPPDMVAPALARAGFNVVSLANNHTLDYGPEGLEDTRAALDKAGIRHAGAGRNDIEARQPVYMMADGVTVAFLAYSLTFPGGILGRTGQARDRLRSRAPCARGRGDSAQTADIVVVSFHWGQEGKTELRDYQTQLAHAAIDAGASAVLGHHPHILQGVEQYKHGVILYSLGNFAFGSYSNTATRSAVALLTFRDRRWRELKLVPLNVKNAEVVFQPRPLVGRDATEVVEHLQQLSQSLGTTLENRDGVAVLVAE
jgi:poly-gamma-glutamate capsule biosynthesis protein CapA/YwtB (metallophosphatase superfamily)